MLQIYQASQVSVDFRLQVYHLGDNILHAVNISVSFAWRHIGQSGTCFSGEFSQRLHLLNLAIDALVYTIGLGQIILCR